MPMWKTPPPILTPLCLTHSFSLFLPSCEHKLWVSFIFCWYMWNAMPGCCCCSICKLYVWSMISCEHVFIPILNNFLHWPWFCTNTTVLVYELVLVDKFYQSSPISKYRVKSVHTLGYLQLCLHNFAGLPTTPNVETTFLRAMLPIFPPVLM